MPDLNNVVFFFLEKDPRGWRGGGMARMGFYFMIYLDIQTMELLYPGVK